MTTRSLPSRRNPLLEPLDDEELRQELLSKRRLGQTELSVDAGQVGTSNATKPKNLGPFDYAHIRVPLPKDLKGSGIFHAARGHSTPEAYFLMRRSSDGFVSASGLFKVAYPWASEEEESVEKAYLKSLPEADREEIAGNIWVPPRIALDLAEEYDIRDWLLILLDPTPMPSNKQIKAPPVYHIPTTAAKSESPVQQASPRNTRAKTPTLNGTVLPPPESPKDKSPRKRALRSLSPTKIPAPDREMKTPRKIATPKRTKRGRTAAGSASVEPEEALAAATTTKSTRKTSGRQRAVKEEIAEEETVTVAVPAEDDGDERETITTPAKNTTLKLPDEAQAYLDSARKAIDDANKLTASRKETMRGRKRKAGSMSRDDDEEVQSGAAAADEIAEPKSRDTVRTSRGADEEEEGRVAKRVRITPVEERRKRIEKRATYGIGIGLAVGALVPWAVTTFFGSI